MGRRASRPNASLFQHSCTAIQPSSCNEHKAGAVQQRSRPELAAAAGREGWDESVGWGGDWARAWWGGTSSPNLWCPCGAAHLAVFPVGCPIPPHRAQHPPDPTPGQTNCPSPPRSLAPFARCRCGKLGVATRPLLLQPRRASHQRQRHLISHRTRLAESSPFTLRLLATRGRVNLVGGYSSQCIFFGRRDGQAFLHRRHGLLYLGQIRPRMGNGPGMSREQLDRKNQDPFNRRLWQHVHLSIPQSCA